MNQIFDLLLFLLPIYISNSIPVVLGGGVPLDFGITLSDGERLFGKGKTVRGFLAGIFGGSMFGGIVAIFYQLPFFSTPTIQFAAAFVLAFATMFGDAFGSFLKRRLHMDSGRPFILDTVLFLLVSLIFVFPLASIGLYDVGNILFFLILTLILHPLTNMLANKAGLKNVPW
ncbi:CDP-2,3-bis-(O-geranylgeranyl)-sn-glycerol synthase [Candidatus Micrarchaeota archaeon]|nr:CDP-2,3-bis-(O-geranylgeranyl)-sn-glycerol synthase [Candidatus Micrarchaeota archaeon]